MSKMRVMLHDMDGNQLGYIPYTIDANKMSRIHRTWYCSRDFFRKFAVMHEKYSAYDGFKLIREGYRFFTDDTEAAKLYIDKHQGVDLPIYNGLEAWDE